MYYTIASRHCSIRRKCQHEASTQSMIHLEGRVHSLRLHPPGLLACQIMVICGQDGFIVTAGHAEEWMEVASWSSEFVMS
jgi:hypothetical protein